MDRVLIGSATGMAYGSPVHASGWIDIPEPYSFHLVGQLTRLDLRLLPPSVPVPHIRSSLTFDYDATGRFHSPVLAGTATFKDSTFLDARVAAGAHGAIDTSGRLVTYSADGPVAGLDIGQIGVAFDLPTLRLPRYAGTVSGGFDLTGAGSPLDDLTVDVKGTGVSAACSAASSPTRRSTFRFGTIPCRAVARDDSSISIREPWRQTRGSPAFSTANSISLDRCPLFSRPAFATT